tara:strand:+ start:1137 stop:1631 length:495 start_codon:yes stop_codon:yes gene_type:complete
MAKKRSATYCYPSRYSDKKGEHDIAWVTARQYIVELVCENKAAQDNKELPSSFYVKVEKEHSAYELNLWWKKFFKQQIYNKTLGNLIDEHGVDKIIAFLKENKYITSLRPKWVHERIDNYDYKGPSRIPIIEQKTGPDEEDKKPLKFRRKEIKDSIISKLKDAE